jgi:molecular chaperone HscB
MDPFSMLGIGPKYTVDLAALEKVHRELSRALHPDRYAGASASERRAALTKAADVNEAWRIVRDPIRRAEALLALRGISVGEDKEPKPAPALLMEMMEAREALEEARGNTVRMEKLAAEMQVRLDAVIGELARLLDEGNDQAALEKLGELRFCRRLIQEVDDAV